VPLIVVTCRYASSLLQEEEAAAQAKASAEAAVAARAHNVLFSGVCVATNTQRDGSLRIVTFRSASLRVARSLGVVLCVRHTREARHRAGQTGGAHSKPTDKVRVIQAEKRVSHLFSPEYVTCLPQSMLPVR